MGRVAAPLYQFGLLPFSFLFLPWFASLALRFAVSSSPPFLPAGPWKGGRCFQAHKGGGWKGAEWKSGLWVGGVQPSACVRGSSGSGGRDSRVPGRRGGGGSAQEGRGRGVKDLKDPCPGGPFAPTLCPSDWEAVLSFPPRSWGGSYVEAILSFFPPPSPL